MSEPIEENEDSMSTESETTTESIVRPSMDDMYGSLTWFDEQAIEKAFSLNIHDLMQTFAEGLATLSDVVKLARAFDYVTLIRDDVKDHAALKRIREMTAGELQKIADAYLAHEEEVLEDEPVTEAGKGGSHASEPTLSSPPSVS